MNVIEVNVIVEWMKKEFDGWMRSGYLYLLEARVSRVSFAVD